MAEIAVQFVIEKLVQLLVEEASNLKGVCAEVKSIKDELEAMAVFLEDAGARDAKSDSIRNWLKEIREVAYGIEDVVDQFMYQAAQRRQKQGVSGFLHRKIGSVTRLKQLHEFASEIQRIKNSVQQVRRRGDLFADISRKQGASSSVWRAHTPVASLFIEEAQLVGTDEPTAVLSRWLQDERAQRSVISVVGMGGVGKTTLAKRVFDAQSVNFDCRAWIVVSQTYTPEVMIKSMIRQFYRSRKESAPARIEIMEDINQLAAELYTSVEKMRYVVVFDDVWSTQFGREMLVVLPENNRRSRVIITTRNQGVTHSVGEPSLNHVFNLQPLASEASWELFTMKVFPFQQDKRRCPPELEDLSMDIVRKCEGLPLALVTIGGVLAAKEKNVLEWRKVHDSLFRDSLESNELFMSVTKILSLSYHDLPLHLKPCLLYFGMFPEGHSIRRSRVMRQWIAEGFIKAPNHTASLEDVAESHLSQLCHRSLVQVSKVDFFGKAREYMVHDLIHDFLSSISKETGFYTILEGYNSYNFDGRNRRLSVMENAHNIFNEGVQGSTVRSLLFFHRLELSKDFTRKLFANFKLLKMLDFEDSPISFLPDELGNLIHLSYLSIRNTKIEFLPYSIGKLQQLETLDMKHSLVRVLPIEIKRLPKLQYLLAYHHVATGDLKFNTIKGVKIQQSLGCSETLQKLCLVEADDKSHDVIQELRNFRELRKLGISKVRREDGKDLSCAIETMKQLRSLVIISLNEQEVVNLESIVSPPPLLQRLWLKGRLEMLPRWTSSLQCLVRLHLNLSGLKDDPLEALQDLPNLLEVGISNDAYVGEQLIVKAGWFQKLKVLRLRELNALKGLTIEESALPQLEELHIGPFSPQVMQVPSGIQYLTTLQVLYFYDMPKGFCMSLVPEEGPNYSIIRHIPTVLLALRCGPLQYNNYTLPDYGRIQARLSH